jgi:predicted MPP superfamily phosphohydrolase
MKIIGTISDLHGRSIWKKFIEDTTVDLWVFVGDFVDSFNISPIEILHNLKEIIEFKKANMDKVILLWGNHDWQYLYINGRTNCAGFNATIANDYQNLFIQNKDLFQIAYKYDNYLFTHAGVTTEWFEMAEESLVRLGLNSDLSNIDDCLNMLQYVNDSDLFNYKGARVESMYIAGSPIWADIKEMQQMALPNFTHVVGHTAVNKRMKYDTDGNAIFPFYNNTYFTDCLAEHSVYLKLEI